MASCFGAVHALLAPVVPQPLGLEIVGGLLLITGLFTRVIAVPFIIEMMVAILSTKISLYLGTSPLPLPPAPPIVGFWAVMHETRSDYAQILTSIFLLVVGPGRWSLDAVLRRRRGAPPAEQQSEDLRRKTALSRLEMRDAR